MRYHPLSIALSVVVALSVVPHASAQERRDRKDSLRGVIARTAGAERTQAREELSRIYFVELRKEGALDTLMTLYDQLETDARQAGNFTAQGKVKSNRIAAYYNKGRYDEVIRQAPDALAFMAENEVWTYYYQISTVLVETYRRKGDFDRALAAVENFYGTAKARDDRGGMGLAQLSLSKICAAQRRYADAERCMRECIDLLQNQTPYLNYLATAYNNLATHLIGQKRYEEALEVAQATEAVNRRYEEASGTPQPSAWYNLWLTYIDIYRQTDAFGMAQRYVDKVDSITNGGVRLYKEQGHIYYGLGRYSEAIEMLDKAIEAFPDNLENKGLKLMTLARMREPDKAVELFSEVIGELETRHNESFNARLDEIRTQYEVDKHIAAKKRNRFYFLFTLGGCIFLVLLLCVTFHYNRLITRKNIDLYKQIKEQDRLEEELAQVKALSRQAPDLTGGGSLPGDRMQRELVDRLHDYLLRDRNLVQAELGRDDLVSALGSNRSTLSEAVKAVTGKTLMEYIRSMQLEEARRLLDKHPELTIEAVACDCGFNAPNTFYRLFRKQYGISPAEYRKIARTQGD